MSFTQFEQRKRDHIRLALAPKNQAIGLTGLDQVRLQHNALPELDFSDITLATTRFGETVKTPFLLSSMTAGHGDAVALNTLMAKACETHGWAMGVGSQRRELSDDSAKADWKTLRKSAPNATLFGNIGLAQIIQTAPDDIQRLVDNLEAAAMIVHTNPLQESLQPEGTPQFKGGLEALARLCKALSVPVILKETGCGFSQANLQSLKNIGLAALDASGLGGTHWGRIEGDRAPDLSIQQQAAETFKNWGVSTVETVLNATKIDPDYEIWASGGLRSGLDAAKMLGMGAQTVGFAKPMLVAALDGEAALDALMAQFEYELRMALFLTGSPNIADLQERTLWAY